MNQPAPTLHRPVNPVRFITAASLFDGQRELVPILRVMQALVGIRRELLPAFNDQLGSLQKHFTVWK